MEKTFVIGCQPMDLPGFEEMNLESTPWDELDNPPNDEDGILHVLHVIRWAEGGREEMEGYAVGTNGGASLGQRLRRMGSHIVHLGSPSSQEGRSLLQPHGGDDGVSPPTSPPASPRRPRAQPPPEEAWA